MNNAPWHYNLIINNFSTVPKNIYMYWCLVALAIVGYGAVLVGFLSIYLAMALAMLSVVGYPIFPGTVFSEAYNIIGMSMLGAHVGVAIGYITFTILHYMTLTIKRKLFKKGIDNIPNH